ncbi:MAG: protoporphyrinogen oxidase [candidate division Zixibacteria bacterium]
MKKVAIIGGGISGLSTLHFLRRRHSDKYHPTLFEKESRLGGTIGTDRKDGFISDWGPNGFLDKVPLTLQLVSELGIDDLLEPANPKAEKRYIYRNKKLHEINPSPPKFLSSPLISLRGRARLMGEFFIKAKTNDDDESIFDFAQRRIGREAAETLIVPMVSGIYGGDAQKLSLRACFPIMEEMEKNHGSLIKAMIARKKQGSKGGPVGPQGRLTSFKNGLNTLIETFEKKYFNDIKSGMEVIAIRKINDGFELNFKFTPAEKYDAVICAAPAYAASALTGELNDELSQLLSSIPYASITVACFGYKSEYIEHDLSGFGFLIPRNQDKRILGSIWTSSIFFGRSPMNMVQLRTMIGGATDPEAINLTDDELTALFHRELSEILGIKNEPDYVKIFKWLKGIPQFVMGHPDKIKKLMEFESKFPGLYFTGNAYDGIGLNDCIIRSEKVVSNLNDASND